jgi:hypothetical protein
VQTAATSIDSVTGGVTIDWIAPHDGSQEITSYLIEIQNALATGFFEDETFLTACFYQSQPLLYSIKFIQKFKH